MRFASPFVASFLLISSCELLSATEVRNGGVPAGWSALQYDNYGNDLLNQHKYAASRKYFDAALRIEPTRWTAYYNRATAYSMEGNWSAAIQDLNKTIQLQPAFFIASWMRAHVYRYSGDYAAALKDLDVLAKVTFQVQNPGELGLVLNERAWIRATCPDGSFRNAQLAVADAKKACDLEKWKNSSYIDTLAAACAESGDFDKAIQYEQQAITLNKSGDDESLKSSSKKYAEELAKGNAERMKGYLQHLESYKQRHPYRDTKRR